MPPPLWAFADECPNLAQPPDQNHCDHLMASYQPIPITTTSGATVTTKDGVLFARFPPPPPFSCHFSALANFFRWGRLPRQLPLAKANILRPPPTIVVTTIATGDVAIPDCVFFILRLFYGQSQARHRRTSPQTHSSLDSQPIKPSPANHHSWNRR